jgi:hypothetical protein
VPSVRARHLRANLDAVDRLPEREAIRCRLSEEILRGIAGAHGIDWLPVAWDVALVRAMHAAMGAEAQHAFARTLLLESFDGPLLGPLVRAAIAMFGLDAGSWVRWIPKGWALMFRRCGTWSVERAARGDVLLRLEGLPPVCLEDLLWLRSVASSLSALQARVGVPGETVLEEADAVRRIARYRVRWGPVP